MAIILKNRASTYLSAAISSTDTSLTVTDGTVFPALASGEYFYMTIEATTGNFEIVKVTAISENTLTVTRAQEDTLAIPFVTSSRVEMRVTVQNIEDTFAEQAGNVLLL